MSKALHDVSLISARLDLSGDAVLKARVEARDADAGMRLAQLAKESGPVVQSAYATFRARLLRVWVADAADAILSVTDPAMTRAKVIYEPTCVQLEIEKPESLDDLGARHPPSNGAEFGASLANVAC